MELRFGTDGVRGRAYDELTLNGAARIGRAVARTFGAQVVIGADTRASSPDLVAAVAAGVATTSDLPSVFVGVAPTPAVAWISAVLGLPAVMVSASHNVWSDNGIKVFAPGGRKLDDSQQDALEAAANAGDDVEVPDRRDRAITPSSIDERLLIDGQRYISGWQRALVASVPRDALSGLKVVLDAANGAASSLSAAVLASAGADVDLIFASPNGHNINDGCGSTHPEALAGYVVDVGADVGIALDGDADRMVAVDHRGTVIDGDAVLALLAQRLADNGRLAERTVVVTVMTNLGFHHAMAEREISVQQCGVGDRHVLEMLDANGWNFGGEQSGHVVFKDHATTGDGTLAALQLLDLVASSKRPLGDLAASVMTRLPQVTANVAVAARVDGVAELLAEEIAAVEDELGSDGRVLVRASGTEPLIRIMVEAPTETLATEMAQRLNVAVTSRFAG